MNKYILSFLAIVFALSITSKFPAHSQNAPPSAPHLPRGTATDVNNSEIDTLVRKVAAVRVSDQAIRVISINSEYNVGVSVVSRLKTSGKRSPQRHRAQPDHGGLSRHLRQRNACDRRHSQ